MAPGPLEVQPPIAPVPVKKELKSSKSPIPEVKTFDASTVTVEELVVALRVAGGVVIKNMLTKEEVEQIENDVRPWLEKDIPWQNGSGLRYFSVLQVKV